MPKGREQAGDGHAEVVIFAARVRGGNETVQDAIRTFGETWTRSTQSTAAVRVVKPLPINPTKMPDSPNGQGTLFSPDPDEPAAEPQDEVVEEVVQESEAPARKPRQPKPPSYSLVSGLNLRPAGKPPLKDFFAQKSPKDQQEQAAVFVYYLSHMLRVTKVGPNHLYTCFKEVGSRSPTNISKLVTKVVARKGWIDASAGDGYTSSTAGQNFVEHDLPNKGDRLSQ